ncbi:MAG: hypothetical protein ABI778_01965 [Ignavibacteriota bacterium]
MIRILFILAVFCVGTLSARPGGQAPVEYVRPLSDVARLLTIRQERNLERALGRHFPARSLGRAVHGKGKIAEKRITYEVLEQRHRKYAVAILSGLWQSEASQLVIYRLGGTGNPTPIYRSRPWRSNYADSYHDIQTYPCGRETIVMIKEGENGRSPFVIASFFRFHERRSAEEGESYARIFDLTPRLGRLRAVVDFPLRPLYAQGIKLRDLGDHLVLQAADVELLWSGDHAKSAMEFWNYDHAARKFLPREISDDAPAMTGQ